MNEDMLERVLNLQLPDNDTRPVDMPDEPIHSNTDFSDLESRMDDIMNRDKAARKIQKYTRKRKKDKKGGGPKHKYDYPPDFLTKKGTLKKSHLKKAAEFRKNYGTLSRTTSVEDVSDSAFEHRHKPLERHEQKGYLVDANKVKFKNKTKKKNISGLTKGQLDFLEGIKQGTSSPELEQDNKFQIEELPSDVYNKIFESHLNNRSLNEIEKCRLVQEYCRFNKQNGMRCAFDEDFRQKYVYPCTKTGKYIKSRKTYGDYTDYRNAITPEAKRESRRLLTSYNINAPFGRKYTPAKDYVFNRKIKSISGTKYGPVSLSRSIGTTSNKYSRGIDQYKQSLGRHAIMVDGLTWSEMQDYIINNPEFLDDLIANFRLEARERGYKDSTIDKMIEKIIDELYVEY